MTLLQKGMSLGTAARISAEIALCLLPSLIGSPRHNLTDEKVFTGYSVGVVGYPSTTFLGASALPKPRL